MKYSSVYQTRPQEFIYQNDFFNMVVVGWTNLEPLSLLHYTSQIEALAGRDRQKEKPKGPRTLDIDIELIGQTKSSSDILKVPHPRINDRLFVLIPLLELLPNCADPVSGLFFKAIVKTLDDQGVKKVGSLYGN